MRTRQGKSTTISWEKFTKHLRAEFVPFNYQRVLYQRLQSLRQGACSVEAYTNDFYRLLARVNITESQDQLVSRFIGGLRLHF